MSLYGLRSMKWYEAVGNPAKSKNLLSLNE